MAQTYKSIEDLEAAAAAPVADAEAEPTGAAKLAAEYLAHRDATIARVDKMIASIASGVMLQDEGPDRELQEHLAITRVRSAGADVRDGKALPWAVDLAALPHRSEVLAAFNGGAGNPCPWCDGSMHGPLASTDPKFPPACEGLKTVARLLSIRVGDEAD